MILAINVYMRVVIIKKYKLLKNKGISIDPKLLLKKEERRRYIAENYPEHETELESFSEKLNILLILVVIGFLMMLLSFLYVYFNR